MDLADQITRLPRTVCVKTSDDFARGIELRGGTWDVPESLDGLEREMINWLEDGTTSNDVSKVSDFIDRHFAERLTLEMLAKVFGGSRRRLSDVFKREAGLTVRQYILRRRMLHAEWLVCQGEKVEVAMLRVGYHNKTHFNRAFARETGWKPGDRSFVSRTLRPNR